jgi:hypothetical protein
MSGLTGTWGELLFKNAAAFAAVNTVAVETMINPPGTGPQALIPGGFFMQRPQSVANTIRLHASGLISTFTSGTWILTLRTNTAFNSIAGSTLVSTGAAFTPIFSITNAYWELDCLLTLSVIGGTALSNIRTFGKFSSPILPTANVGTIPVGPTNLATFDTTVNNWLSLSATPSVSSASNSITLEELEVYGTN